MGGKPRRTLAERHAADPNYHHCWCKFHRDNVGKPVIRYVGTGQDPIVDVLGPAPDCKICDNTGWCT